MYIQISSICIIWRIIIVIKIAILNQIKIKDFM